MVPRRRVVEYCKALKLAGLVLPRTAKPNRRVGLFFIKFFTFSLYTSST
ncbi:hypothetical protein HMPREF9554_02551 [Treponema phagedenis F0421]|nr:hypothetical protein HMPREF9554_02551 [Treponema phagedenis F0421]